MCSISCQDVPARSRSPARPRSPERSRSTSHAKKSQPGQEVPSRPRCPIQAKMSHSGQEVLARPRSPSQTLLRVTQNIKDKGTTELWWWLDYNAHKRYYIDTRLSYYRLIRKLSTCSGFPKSPLRSSSPSSWLPVSVGDFLTLLELIGNWWNTLKLCCLYTPIMLKSEIWN